MLIRKHIAYKKAILKTLDEDPELTAKKIRIKLIKMVKKNKDLLPPHLLPPLDKVMLNS